MVRKQQIDRKRIAERAKARIAVKKQVTTSTTAPARQREAPKIGKPDAEESTGRRPGRCPLCGARIAYDDDLRMNQHLFKDTIAECVTSYRAFRWMPENVEEGLPKRQRGGGSIHPKDLERIRRVVTKAVALHRDAKRTEAKMTAKRTDARKAALARKNIETKPPGSESPQTIRCISCGQEFARRGESSRRCTICDPPRSTSVRAYRGGLPGLGRRS